MENIFHRVSIRKFSNQPVEKEKIEQILRAAMQAPSACNQQPWEFYVVEDKEMIHATNEGGYISWYDFTKEIYKVAGYTTKVTPVTTEEYGLSKAARPFNSRLDKSKLVENGFTPLPTWQDALRRYIDELDMENL